ncbi:MAG: RNA polymerase sigma factor [Lachnospiraceae bacterium]|nr:RNA polymerase sigma factor [Lachnospiraceae bacterium]
METLYRENVKIVSHYLYSLCGDEELVKDLTQETFLRAYESLERFDGSCKISTWLCQIAKHLLYQHWAKAGRQVPTEQEELTQITSAMEKDNPENSVITRIELIDCLKELQKLPEAMREVVYLRVMSDLSYREIGEIMGKSENWARVNFYRAKELLLKGCGRDE